MERRMTYHTPKHRAKLPKHTHQDEESRRTPASPPTRTARQADHAVIPRLTDHRQSRPKRRNQTPQSITQNPSLNPRIELRALNINITDLSRGKDIRHARHGLADKHDEERQDQRAVDRELEGVHPEEGDGWCGADVGERPVACQPGDQTPERETQDDGCGFHEGGAELLDDDHGYEDGEAEAD